MSTNKATLHKKICEELTKTYIEKNNDYGDSFAKIRKEIPISILIRLSDKIERLKSLMLGNKQMVNNESIEDTLLDLANYAIMEVIELRNDKA